MVKLAKYIFSSNRILGNVLHLTALVLMWDRHGHLQDGIKRYEASCASFFAMGRIVQRANPDEAFRMFQAADKMFRQSTQTNLYAAHTLSLIHI